MKPFLLLVTFFTILYSFHDLGRWGNTYDIKEKIIWKEKNTSIISKKKIDENILKSITSNIKLKHCTQTKQRYFNPTITLDHDIIMPNYNISIKKGSKFNPLKHVIQKRYIVLVDANSSNQLELAEHYKQQSDIIIYNGSVKAIKDYKHNSVFIATKEFNKSFKPECLPSIYTQKDDKFIISEIKLDKDKK